MEGTAARSRSPARTCIPAPQPGRSGRAAGAAAPGRTGRFRAVSGHRAVSERSPLRTPQGSKTYAALGRAGSRPRDLDRRRTGDGPETDRRRTDPNGERAGQKTNGRDRKGRPKGGHRDGFPLWRCLPPMMSLLRNNTFSVTGPCLHNRTVRVLKQGPLQVTPGPRAPGRSCSGWTVEMTGTGIGTGNRDGGPGRTTGRATGRATSVGGPAARSHRGTRSGETVRRTPRPQTGHGDFPVVTGIGDGGLLEEARRKGYRDGRGCKYIGM